MSKIRYIYTGRYCLVENYSIQTDVYPEAVTNYQHITLDVDGKLTITRGFMWDGPSGPTLDTKNSLRASLCHDALYSLMSEKLLDISYKDKADDLLYSLCREDGMSWIRAWSWKKAVNWFGKSAIKKQEQILEAP